MDDTFGKYLRLFGTLFFTFIGFVTALVLLLVGLKFFFGLVDQMSFVVYLYMVLILMFPACLFISVYIIYFRRTKKHPSKPVRIISYIIFIVALGCWVYFFIKDLLLFFKYFYRNIDQYNTYNLLFLFLNVACIFLVGIIQALSTEKEKDWRERAAGNLK
ncbi:MAG: hypothetical protein QM737_02265 [Ferruginibacter sp.]